MIILPQVFCTKESFLSNSSLGKLSPREKQMVGSCFPSGNSTLLPQCQEKGKMYVPGLDWVNDLGGPVARFGV